MFELCKDSPTVCGVRFTGYFLTPLSPGFRAEAPLVAGKCLHCWAACLHVLLTQTPAIHLLSLRASLAAKD